MTEDTVLIGIPEMAGIQDVQMQGSIDERENLRKVLEKEGFNVKKSDVWWPRDYHVYHNNRVISQDLDAPYGEGGGILPVNGAIIATDHFCKIKEATQNSMERILKKLYRVERVHLIKSQHRNNHIDLDMLPIKRERVLIVDRKFYRIRKGTIDRMAETEGLEVRTIPDNYRSGRNFPCNTLLLENDKGNLVAFTNEGNNGSELKDAVKDLDVKVVEIPFELSAEQGGGARCATNTEPKGHNSDYSIFAEMLLSVGFQ